MRQWSIEERTWCVKKYFEYRSFQRIREEFLHQFKEDKSPDRWRIKSWVQKFESFGTLENFNKKCTTRISHSGRKKVRTSPRIHEVKKSVIKSPKRSTRKRSQALAIPRTTLQRILKHDLGLHAYHITTHQSLTQYDMRRREEMATILLKKIESSKNFLAFLWTSDEAHFYLNGQVNSKNNIYWGSKRPTEVQEKALHSQKVTAWCALSTLGIIGPLFFEENKKTVTVTAERYLKVLKCFNTELQTSFSGYKSKVWFQQDGASPHTAHIIRDWLKKVFQGRIVSKHFPFEWAPHSPDLSPPDFFLWGYLKDRVYQERPRTLEQLKEKIRTEVNGITRATLQKVMSNFKLRLELCKEKVGGHLEHLM